MKSHLKLLSILSVIAYSFVGPGSASAQGTDTLFVPIANGNNWLYAYQKNVKDVEMIQPDTAKNGTFQMSMNSVVVQNDSIYFTLSTIDSGLVTIDSAHVIKSFPYRNNYVNDYALIDSVLYKKDSLGVWRKYNSWYLSYLMLPDTAFPPGGLACLNPSSYYSRNTSTSTVIFGTQGHMLDSTHILSENLLTNRDPPTYDLYSSEWASEWIKDIGCSYYVNSYKWIRGFISGGVCESGAAMTDNTESWTLISSNSIFMPLAPPTLVSPKNGYGNQPVSLTLIWNKVIIAASYYVQMALDSGFTSIVMQDSTRTDSLKTISGLVINTAYYWRVRAKNAGGSSAWSEVSNFTTTATGVLSSRSSIPHAFSISGSSGMVRYGLPVQCHVILKYYDLRGRLTATLVNCMQQPGYYALSVRNALPSCGSYIRIFEAGTFVKRELVPMVR